MMPSLTTVFDQVVHCMHDLEKKSTASFEISVDKNQLASVEASTPEATLSHP